MDCLDNGRIRLETSGNPMRPRKVEWQEGSQTRKGGWFQLQEQAMPLFQP